LAAEGELPIEHHLRNYLAALEAGNRTVKHIETVSRIVGRVADFTGFRSIRDISTDGMNRYTAEQRRAMSLRTVQSHLAIFKSFTAWLARNHKLPFDPLSSIRIGTAESDRRRVWRTLMPEEWQWMKVVTADQPVRYGLTGSERALVYELAIQTGLRAAELRSLRRSNFHLDGKQPFVLCHAQSTKNRKNCHQFIQLELSNALQRQFMGKSTGSVAFNLPSEWDTADMLRADLAAAREAYLSAAKVDPNELERRQSDEFLQQTTSEGKLDFHSLRHTCGSWLAKLGAHPKLIQSVMRHSTITLTMDRYGHTFPEEQAELIQKLDRLFPSDAANPAASHLQYVLQQSQHDSERRDATPCESAAPSPLAVASRNSSATAELCEPVRRAAVKNEIHPAGVEPAACGLGNRRSIQLSYGCLDVNSIRFSTG